MTRARRRAVIVAAVLTAGVLIADLAVRSLADGPDQRLAYLDEARPLIAETIDQGRALASLRGEAPGLDRVTFDRRLQRLTERTDATLEDLRGLEPPSSLEQADGLLVATLVIRAKVANRLGAAFDLALGAGTVEQAVEELGALGSDLLVADRTYGLFAEEARAAEDAANPPEAVWVTDVGAWQPPALEALVTSLRQAGTLAAVHDVGLVTVQISPPPLRHEGDVGVLATEEPLRITVVVANRGSEPEARVDVQAGFRGGETVSERVELEPGQDLTVTLEGVVPPPAGTGTLVVRVSPVPDEAAAADNEQQFLLRVRQPGETTSTAPAAPAAPEAATETPGTDAEAETPPG